MDLESDARVRLAENAQLPVDFLETRPALDGILSEDCPFAFLQHESMDGTEISTITWDEGVLVVPGRFFDHPEKFRLSLGGTPEAMAEALDALGSVLDSRA